MEELLKKNDTAFYVFDIQKVKERTSYLKNKLPENVSLCYAIKANTFITGGLIGEVDRFEICSPGEAQICDYLKVPTNQTVISGVYKTPGVMEKLVASSNDRIYTVESMTQFELFKGLSEKYGRKLSLLLRLTNGSQFGINKSDIERIIAEREHYENIEILGVQFFSGTQKSSLKKLKREVERLDELIIKLKDDYGFCASELEYGPGFPVAYFEDDAIDEEEFLSGFSDILNTMESKPKITLELGRSIAACCGRYYTHIVDIKQNKGQNYILIDGGMHHLVYFGQHMAMKHPKLFVCTKENDEKTNTYAICGSLCSMNDIVAKQVSLPDVKIGDIICFENTGAYCMTEGISLFLSREIPAVYLINDDKAVVCVRKAFETSILNTPKDERK